MQGEAEYDERLMTLVESALAKPRDEREAFLRENCETNLRLLEEALSRVEWEDRMDGFLLAPVLNRETPGFTPGRLVAGRFRIVREIGRGGMGRVYEAFDEKLNRRIAVKLALTGLQERMSPEARAALEVSHPHVCKIHEIHTAEAADGGGDFLTMEFIDGETAAERIAREGPLPVDQVRQIALQLCSGLAQAHRQGVIHGDIKAANLMLSRMPNHGIRSVLMDFGLARVGHGGAQAEGGTPAYMAPELLAGSRPSVASDIYAVGVLLHVLLVGSTPDATRPAALPKRWKAIIGRCLRADPEGRFESADQLAHALSARPAVTRWILAAAVLMIAILALTLWRNRADPGPPVRLAVLPFQARDSGFDAAAAVAADVADRLHGIRREFSITTPGEAGRRRVATPEQARSVLNATHVLLTRIRRTGAAVSAEARLIDAVSGQVQRELTGEYTITNPSALAKALIAMVTRHFGLRSDATREAVSGAAYGHYIRGVELLRSDPQSAPDAIPHLRKAIELDPGSALPWARLAQAQVQTFQLRGRNLDEAGASIAKAKSINADSVPVLLASSAYLQMHGRYEQAAEELNRATQLEPSDAEVWRRLGALLQRTDRPVEAAAALRKAIEVQPGDYVNYMSLGIFHFNRNEYIHAEDVFRRALAIDPQVAGAHMNLGVTLLAQGKFVEAEQRLLAGLKLRRTPAVLMNLGTLNYEQERYQQALRWYQEAIAAGAPNAARYRSLGDAYMRLGQKARALQAYDQGLALAEEELNRNPRSPEMRALVGLLCVRIGDRRRARAELHQAFATGADNALVMRDVAIAWEALGLRDRTYESVRRAPLFLMEQLNRHPDLRALQKDSRFQTLLATAKSEQPTITAANL